MVDPKHKIKSGNISVAIFENKSKDKSGKEFSYDSIQLQRSYTIDSKDGKEKTWKHEKINLRKNDLQKIKSVIDKAMEYEFIS